MKKLLVAAGLLLLFSLQACAQQEPWIEGTHYEVISDEGTETPQITEFFSFWCPHCFSFEPLVAQIKQKMDDKTTFNKVHVNFMGFTGPDVQNAATRAMLVGRSLNKEESMNQAIFQFIHVQKGTVTGLEDLKSVFVAQGVPAEEFDKLAQSFNVNSQLNNNNKTIDQYREHIRGVPNFIVNGKYQAKFTREMTSDDIVDLIVWLSNKS